MSTLRVVAGRCFVVWLLCPAQLIERYCRRLRLLKSLQTNGARQFRQVIRRRWPIINPAAWTPTSVWLKPWKNLLYETEIKRCFSVSTLSIGRCSCCPPNAFWPKGGGRRSRSVGQVTTLARDKKWDNSIVNRNNATTEERGYHNNDPQSSSVGIIVIQLNSLNVYDREHPTNSTMRIR